MRWPLASVVFLVLAAACSQNQAGSKPGRSRSTGPVAVERGTLSERLVLTGELKAEQSVRLNVPVTRIWQLSIRWLADDGKKVAAGDRVVEFDSSSFTSDLDQKELALAQANLDYQTQQATSAGDVSAKEFAVAKQVLLLEQAQLRASAPQDLITERDWDERQLALERAKVALINAESDLAATRRASSLELKVQQVAVEKIERDLKATEEGISALTLYAPQDGVLLVPRHPWEGRKLQVGDVMQPGWTAMELPDLKAMKVEAVLSDVDDGRVAVGMLARCTLDAYPDRVFEGRVREVAPVAQELARQSLRRGFQVDIALDQTDIERMRPGMSVKVEIVGEPHGEVLTVARRALRISESGVSVKLASGDTVEVELGPCNAQKCVVTSGLEEGQELTPEPEG